MSHNSTRASLRARETPAEARNRRRHTAAERSRELRWRRVNALVYVIENLDLPLSRRLAAREELIRTLRPGEGVTVLDCRSGGCWIEGGIG